MRHRVQFWHGERELLVDYITDQAPYVPPLKSAVTLRGWRYQVAEVRSTFDRIIEGNMALEEGWTVVVIVYRTEAELPTLADFGR